MKDLRSILYATIAVTGLVACQEKDDSSQTGGIGNGIPITLEVVANVASQGVKSRTYTPSYRAENLRIQAYKLDEEGGDFLYSRSFLLSDTDYMSFAKTWRGDVMLERGTYKFIPTYGLDHGNSIAFTLLEEQPLSSAIQFTYLPDNNNPLPEIFLPLRQADEIRSYQVDAIDRQREAVRDTLSRAVSRLDVMFIKARKEGDAYIEEAYGNASDVFGQLGLGKLEFRLTGVANKMNILGETQAGLTDAVIQAPYLSQGAVTIGTNPEGTLVGEENYFRFDSIRPSDIMQGSAHVFGTYLLPDQGEPTARLQLYMEPLHKTGSWTARTINIEPVNYDAIPFEQNKVTLIKVYVLRGDHLFAVDGDDPRPDPVPGPDPETFEAVVEVEVRTQWNDTLKINPLF